MTPLAIIGAGDLGRETVALVERINEAHSVPRWDLKTLLDNNPDRHADTVLGVPVQGAPRWLADHPDVSYVVAVGRGQPRQHVVQQLDNIDVSPATLVDPSVSIHRTTTLGAGTVVYAGCVFMVNVSLGSHTIVDAQCTLGHDAVLESFVTLHPGVRISGHVYVEKEARLGAGSVILPECHIGAGATVGAGAVVTKDVPPGATAVGVPARVVS